ncbi:hypothetical protein TNCV_1716581 [Trichonephila clavipes]|nr:hypothetical protein TNCV_1716581 [Trichonephila clavipes]
MRLLITVTSDISNRNVVETGSYNRWNNQANGSVYRGTDPRHRFQARWYHGQEHQSHMGNKDLDEVPNNPEADLKRLFNPAIVVEDTAPKRTNEQWEDSTQLLGKFQGIFVQNMYDVGCINLESEGIHL